MGRVAVSADPADTRRTRLTARTLRLTADPDASRARLAASSVLVVGAGGLGSPVVALLAGSGIGRLTIVDPDVVDDTNLSRQTLYTTADLDRAKSLVAAERAVAVDPDLDSRGIVGSFTADLVRGHDVVVDAADSVAVTRAVSDACAEAGIPWVWGSVLGFDGQASTFWDARGIDFHDLHPDPAAELDGTCAVVGVLPSLCHSVGSVLAAQVLALVAGIGEPLLGTVLTVDAASWEWTRSRLRRRPGSGRPEFLPPVASERIDAAALAQMLAAGSPTVSVVDVRTAAEVSTGSIPGSITVDAVSGSAVTAADEIVVVCERGPRAQAWAATAAADLPGRVRVLDGGMVAWRAAGGATVR